MKDNTALPVEIIKSITNQIHKKYPEFAGVAPKVRRQSLPEGSNTVNQSHFLFTFKTHVHANDHVIIPRSIRVTVNEKGKIIKVTTSR